MRYHPHVHFVVPGGGFSPDGKWLPAHRDYLMPAKALARIFRAKFRDALKKTALFNTLPPETWQKEWVIDIRAVGKGRSVLKYLAPYVFRVAISNKRILSLKEGQVTFEYKSPDRKYFDTATVPVEEFTPLDNLFGKYILVFDTSLACSEFSPKRVYPTG